MVEATFVYRKDYPKGRKVSAVEANRLIEEEGYVDHPSKIFKSVPIQEPKQEKAVIPESSLPHVKKLAKKRRK